MAGCGDIKNKSELRIFESLDELVRDFAEYIAEVSEASVKERGAFSVALSGRSVISLMRKLCETPYNKTVDWKKWHVFWADERAVSKSHVESNYRLTKDGFLFKTVDWKKWHVFWADERAVSKSHVESNYRLTKDGFLFKVPVLTNHIYSINDSLTVEAAASRYEFAIRQLVKARTVDVSESNDCPKFDLILLGMGDDGHVASLFPHHPALELKDDWVTYITDSPKAPPERITFTLPVINSASNVAIVVTGESKAMAVKLAVSEDDEGELDAASVPARLVRPTDGKLVWFLDEAAASFLDARDEGSQSSE